MDSRWYRLHVESHDRLFLARITGPRKDNGPCAVLTKWKSFSPIYAVSSGLRIRGLRRYGDPKSRIDSWRKIMAPVDSCVFLSRDLWSNSFSFMILFFLLVLGYWGEEGFTVLYDMIVNGVGNLWLHLDGLDGIIIIYVAHFPPCKYR